MATATTHSVMRSIGSFVFLLLAGLLMAATALPRLMAELALVPGTPYMKALYAGEALEEKELSLIETTRLEALEFADHAGAAYELAALYSHQARRTSTDEERAANVNKTIAFSRLAIDDSPVNAFYWLQLASGLSQKGTSHHAEALDAWDMSFKTANFEPALLLQRIHLGMILLPAMSEQQVGTLKDQVEMSYRWHRGLLRNYARQHKLLPSLEYLMGSDNEIVEYVRP